MGHGRSLETNASAIAYVAGSFPKRSETFVYREVRALRENGKEVVCASLHAPEQIPEKGDDLTGDLLTVYSNATLSASLRELRENPWQSTQTVLRAIGDALAPGEPLALSERAKLLAQATAALGLAHELRKRKTSHVHAHFAHAPTTVAMYAARQLGVSFSFTGHANDIFQRRSLLRHKLKRAAFISCISEWHRDFYAAEEPRCHQRLHVVRCGVDTDEWLPVEQQSSPSEPLRLITVCRLVQKKGIDILIRALPLLEKKATLVVAGDGPESDKLKKLARDVGASDQITWLGAVENDHARRALREAQVFVLPCRTDDNGDRDGIPVALMEAMASGLVVVSGDLPAIRELIEDKSSGILLPNDEPQTLARVLDELATHPLGPMAGRGRERIEEEFSLQKNIERLTQLVERRGDVG